VTSDLESSIATAAGALRAGGLVVYPTETFYALGALARDAAAVARLAAAKGRPDGKPLPLLAGDVAQVEEVALPLDAAARALARAFWPGPLTLVLAARPGLPPEIGAGTGTVAIRVPGSDVARHLAALAGGPLVSTSANLSGAPPPRTPADLAPELLSRVDLVLDGGPAPGGRPSTIVALDGATATLVRDGPIPLDAVRRVLDPSVFQP
jgi:L-threonylcarbamoyladenylate synthase